MRRFTLLARPGCHLCEELEVDALQWLAGRAEIEVVQIDHHPEWLAQYAHRVPVLLDESGAFLCAVTLDTNALSAALS